MNIFKEKFVHTFYKHLAKQTNMVIQFVVQCQITHKMKIICEGTSVESLNKPRPLCIWKGSDGFDFGFKTYNIFNGHYSCNVSCMTIKII